jgi:hypothetical protein
MLAAYARLDRGPNAFNEFMQDAIASAACGKLSHCYRDPLTDRASLGSN